MKIELKNLKVNLEFSEETIMFRSDVHINGMKIFYADNDGRGGCTSVHVFNPMQKQMWFEVDRYCRDNYDMYFTDKIDELVYAEIERREKQKFSKKINKDMQKGIILSKDDLKSYSIVSWKGKTINDLLSQQGGETVLKNTVDKYQAQGYKVYNTNLPHHILKP